mgnify:CR=1 FL=1
MNQDIHKVNFCNFRKNSNFSLFISIEWLEMIIRHKKWLILIQLAEYISKFAANLSGSLGYVVMSKQWGCQKMGGWRALIRWVLGRSVNPISTRGGHIILTQYYEPPPPTVCSNAFYVDNRNQRQEKKFKKLLNALINRFNSL